MAWQSRAIAARIRYLFGTSRGVLLLSTPPRIAQLESIAEAVTISIQGRKVDSPLYGARRRQKIARNLFAKGVQASVLCVRVAGHAAKYVAVRHLSHTIPARMGTIEHEAANVMVRGRGSCDRQKPAQDEPKPLRSTPVTVS